MFFEGGAVCNEIRPPTPSLLKFAKSGLDIANNQTVRANFCQPIGNYTTLPAVTAGPKIHGKQ